MYICKDTLLTGSRTQVVPRGRSHLQCHFMSALLPEWIPPTCYCSDKRVYWHTRIVESETNRAATQQWAEPPKARNNATIQYQSVFVGKMVRDYSLLRAAVIRIKELQWCSSSWEWGVWSTERKKEDFACLVLQCWKLLLHYWLYCFPFRGVLNSRCRIAIYSWSYCIRLMALLYRFAMESCRFSYFYAYDNLTALAFFICSRPKKLLELSERLPRSSGKIVLYLIGFVSGLTIASSGTRNAVTGAAPSWDCKE